MAEWNDKIKEYIAFDPLKFPEFRKRTIGSGSIGGKAKGLLYSSMILKQKDDEILKNVVIPESYFIASSMYDDYLAQNEIDLIIEESPNDIDRIRQAIFDGEFSEEAQEQFETVLRELTCPLAIRSSSMLEDSVRFSFAGKYFTTFIPNTGTMEERLSQLISAIKQIYASTYGKNAVVYRRKHALSEERMAVIIQELFGKRRGSGFYPEVAGVGFSENYRRFTERIRKEDGVVRWSSASAPRALPEAMPGPSPSQI